MTQTETAWENTPGSFDTENPSVADTEQAEEQPGGDPTSQGQSNRSSNTPPVDTSDVNGAPGQGQENRDNAPAQPTNEEVQDISIHLIQVVYTLGERRQPSYASVPNGRIAVAYHDFESFSNTGLPEVYLTGETIRTQGFIRRTRCHVVELQEYPGTISYTMMQFLCGVSQGASDMASVRLVFNLSLEDPIRLLRHASNILEPTTREDLNARVEQMIREELASATNTSDLTRGALQLWYHPDVRKAADSVFARLDRLLRQWGIRLTSDSSAYRHYPAVLREMVLQLRAVEQDILSIDNLAQLTPQFSPGDMAKIKNVSKTSGDGSGLFTVIRNKRRNAQVFSDIVGWLDSENASAPLVANLFRELYLNQNAYSRQAIELSELVILSAFERQEMGFEWGETESKTIGA